MQSTRNSRAIVFADARTVGSDTREHSHAQFGRFLMVGLAIDRPISIVQVRAFPSPWL